MRQNQQRTKTQRAAEHDVHAQGRVLQVCAHCTNTVAKTGEFTDNALSTKVEHCVLREIGAEIEGFHSMLEASLIAGQFG